MATLNDSDARPHLSEQEIGRLEAAGARKVVVELGQGGEIRAVACWMKRDAPDQYVMVRFGKPLAGLGEQDRARLLEHIERRVRDHHDALPMTDEELRLLDQQMAR